MNRRLAGSVLAAVTPLLVTALSALCVASAQAQSQEIRIAHVYSKTGPLEAYGKQTATGFMMGLDYATQGTMTVAGKKLVVIEKDDQAIKNIGSNIMRKFRSLAYS